MLQVADCHVLACFGMFGMFSARCYIDNFLTCLLHASVLCVNDILHGYV